mmetsp:Transcript_43568/g.103550  ORF Transcript_43568/g.103550 Transcript_43568/m.103550 type:complete len:303 (+) Transcript_43568:106-1014(+)|eukprot:CAMPEP_0180129372 /NCGR_PEP_ID=MMETSP0986-20121125/7278_1 /TAXON_ID=697907 /ORGANISM="non described non described, Strain CCMP2293" /LENGTH=302 /DNA_ID=CAMNT_0022069031 /DNA_START=80 /DNA_END=988 /DNA_ORIENTATION=+
MPAKSKKEVKAKQKAVVEDKTFGLKNKNKSKVVQQFVSQVVESAKRAGLTNDQCKQREAEQAAKAARKDGKIADKELNRLLFTIPLTKKQKEADERKKLELEAAAARLEEGPEMVSSDEAYAQAKREEDLLRAQAVLGEQKDDDLYDSIERERLELRKAGKMTPVTYDSFVAWKARKVIERRQKDVEEAKKMLQAASRAKGKSGRDLFSQLTAMDPTLFLDDDEADDDWMKRDNSDDEDAPIYDIQVTGTTFSLKKKAGGDEEKEKEWVAEKTEEEALAGGVDAALFLDDDVDLPSDDDDEE